ncbi:hypothetical protein PanWU01x14_210460 [Parasponia andersonii]|uniref:Uncharacterized protein n=1 Tax=Parasponia andersonii TaxID=3476 RepID=A0A2P5BTZ3_PARAD|nr:hypothetical protein PanWU01x14_210460 [Parasponia andersonii]
MGARAEASRKHCVDLAGINSLLLDLSQRQAELRRRRPGLGSYREQTGHYHADVSLRPKVFLRGSASYSLVVCPQLIIRTFSRVVDGRRESQSASNFEVCWQVLALHSSSLFARFLGSSTGDQFTLRTFSRVVDGRRESQSASKFEVCWQVLALHSSSLFARFLGSSTGDVSPKVRAILRSAGKFWLCTAVHSSHVFSGRRRATSTTFAAAQHVGFAHAARPFLLSIPGK